MNPRWPMKAFEIQPNCINILQITPHALIHVLGFLMHHELLEVGALIDHQSAICGPLDDIVDDLALLGSLVALDSSSLELPQHQGLYFESMPATTNTMSTARASVITPQLTILPRKLLLFLV